MVNLATEDLQHRILDYSKYCLLHCHMKIERVREREERLRWWREQYKARRERETEEQWQSRLSRQRKYVRCRYANQTLPEKKTARMTC